MLKQWIWLEDALNVPIHIHLMHGIPTTIKHVFNQITILLGFDINSRRSKLSGRLDEIKQEWRLNTKEKVKNSDPIVFSLMTDPQFSLPTNIPDAIANNKL